MKKLKKELDNCIKKYVELFCKKHELDFDYWIADRTGEVACFGDYYVNFEDIRFDLEKDVPKYKFFDWYDLTLELSMKDKQTINYSNFIKLLNS